MLFNRLIPELTVVNLEKSLDFYTKLLGFEIEYAREESKFVFLSMQGSQLMLEERNGGWETGILEYPFGRGINFQITVSSLTFTSILDALAVANYPLMKPPWECWYRKNNNSIGLRQFLVQDPDGYLLRFAESLGER